MKKEILFFVFLIVFCGCSGDDNVASKQESTTPVPLSIASASVLLSTQSATKATFTELKSDSIGVFLFSTNGYTALNNIKYIYDLSWTSKTPIYLGSAAAGLCSYYPYNKSWADAKAIPLASQGQSAMNDLCYAGPVTGLTNIAPSVNFQMKRAYSMITFHITKKANYTGACAISSITLANGGLKKEAKLDITTEAYTEGTLGNVIFNPTTPIAITAGEPKDLSVLMIPASDLLGNLTFTFVVDTKPMTASLDVTTNFLTKLEAANNYKIDVTISGTGLLVNSVTLEDWRVKVVPNPISLE